jgi:DNA-binding response OmpR family regulator
VVKALAYLPSVVVIEIALPLMDGARVARVLRSNIRTSMVPMIAFTGTRLDARDYRLFDALVPKPCAPEVLVHTVRWILAGRERRSGR